MSETQKSAQVVEVGKPLVVREVPIPKPQEGELLIKIEATTINPSDRLQLEGAFGQPPLPFTGGKEGTGKVV